MSRITKRALGPFHIAALAAAVALPLAAPLSAGDKSERIHGTSQAKMMAWQEATTRQLDRLMTRAPMARHFKPNESVVQVTFSLDAQGKPQDVTVLDGDGNIGARKIARYAVERLSGMDTAPVADPRKAKFLANLIFANDEQTRRELAGEVATPERLAVRDGEEVYIVVTL